MDVCQIELTNYCNLQCRGCTGSGAKRNRGLMSPKIFRASLDVCEKTGVKEVWLQNWGESLLHPHLMVYLSFASKKFTAGLITNGTLLTPYMVSYLKFNGLSKLDISINSQTPQGLVPYLLEIYKVANMVGLDCYIRSVVFNLDDYMKLKEELGDLKVRWQRGMIIDESKIRTSDCPAIDKVFVIYYDGTIVPCCRVIDGEISYGNVTWGKINSNIDKGRMDLHKQLESDHERPPCSHCFEVDFECPELSYKLSGS